MTFVEPAYGSHTLADVLPAVGRALGASVGSSAESASARLDLPPAPSYVVLLVNGLGSEGWPALCPCGALPVPACSTPPRR